MNLEDIAPQITERAFIVGRTGMGKTFFARRLLNLPRYKYVSVMDTKGLLHWPGYSRYVRLKQVTSTNPFEQPKVIYAPRREELDDPNYWYAFFEWNYRRKNTTVYVDEAFGVTHNQTIPRAYFACLTRGRELGITVISSAQRPVNLPNTILSEADRFFVFNLNMANDRKKMEETIPLERGQSRGLPKYHFLYYRDGSAGVSGPHKLTIK